MWGDEEGLGYETGDEKKFELNQRMILIRIKFKWLEEKRGGGERKINMAL